MSRSMQSEYQVVFEYYKDVQAAALRTYITAQLSYMILHLHESGDFRNQSIAYQMMFRQINDDVRKVFKSNLESANRDIWTCDPLDYNGWLLIYALIIIHTLTVALANFNLIFMHIHLSVVNLPQLRELVMKLPISCKATSMLK